MTVADMFSAGGYYTELLAGVVGPNGKVIAVNNVPYAQYSKKDRKARFTEGRLKNVEPRLVEASYMNLPAKSVDLVVIVMSYHDAYWIDEKEGWPEINTDGLHRLHQAHAQARRQTADRRSQCARRHAARRWPARRID